MKVLLRLGLAALFVAPVLATGKEDRANRGSTTSSIEKIAPGKCLISGTAVNSDEVPLPHRPVRLRNLETLAVEQVSTTDRMGTFSFIANAETTYVVEVVDQAGRVIGIGEAVIARAGEVAGGFVIVPAAIPTYSSIFKSAAGAVLAALGGTGLTALHSDVPPLSPEQ